MAFSSLRTVSFRNLEDAEIDVRGKDIFLIGENGQGKSNFLEALYFCSYASSFRVKKDSDLVKEGERNCSVSLNIENSPYLNVSVVLKDGKKIISLDGKRIDDRKNLLSVAPTVIFCHEDMEFVAGTPEKRRWFFDQTWSLWDPLYLEDLQKYRYVLKNRNAVFRSLGNGSRNSGRQRERRINLPDDTIATLDALDPQLALYGLGITGKRHETTKDFSFVFEPLYREISGIEGIGIQYIPSWKEVSLDGVISLLANRREVDASVGVSLSGPHRDRYLFTRNGEDFSLKASTGQRRLLALLLRIAQAKVFSEKTGRKPVLLFDDVLLELDGEKRKKFLSVMPEYEQAFYTFLSGEPYQSYCGENTIVYNVCSGHIG